MMENIETLLKAQIYSLEKLNATMEEIRDLLKGKESSTDEDKIAIKEYPTFAELIRNTITEAEKEALLRLPICINGTEPDKNSYHMSGLFDEKRKGRVHLTDFNEDGEVVFLNGKLEFISAENDCKAKLTWMKNGKKVVWKF